MGQNEGHVLLLHIGTPKTGTTVLQKFLSDNADVLETYGWQYPKENALGDKNGVLFYDVYEEKLNQEPGHWDAVWSGLREKLKKNHVILSSENIYDWDMERLLRLAKREYGNIKVLIYLRRQDLYLESYWNQWVKLGHFTGSLAEFEESFEELSSAHYLKKLELICDVVGKENLTVRVFEKGQWKGKRKDLFSDFLDAVGLDPDWSQFRIEDRANERLSGNFLELKQAINCLPGFDKNPMYQQYFMQLCQNRPGGGISGKKEGYFSREGRERYLAQFEEENRVIARTFLHREDGILFYDGNTDIPQSRSEASSLEADMARLFALMLDREVNRLKENSVHMASRGRKIAFFGAGAYCRQILRAYHLNVSVIIDNDRGKRGTEVLGVPVILPEEILDWRAYLILITCGNAGAVEEELMARGLQKWEHYLTAQEVFFSESIL